MKGDNIDEIKKEVKRCVKCSLCKSRTRAVPGVGNPKSNVIFIGEAPGRNEDKKGEPFVGAAGKKLDEALKNAGISREEIYITNVVKCRPPGNRVPNQEEQQTCIEYLKREIQIIRPKIICIMGNTAYGSLLGGNNIMKERGKVIRKDGENYFLTIHPAATIYNQDLLKFLKDDMIKLVKIIQKKKN